MSDEDKNKEDNSEKGTTSLLLGAGVGTYGTTMFLASGFICPACVFVAPTLLGVGAYQRKKYNDKKKLETDTSNSKLADSPE